MAKTTFRGFHPRMLQFLDELASHNNRDWFAKNKPRYESEVLAPALQFVEAMQRPLEKIAPHLLAIPKRTGGSVMRIYRDTRFGHDKTPYKTNVGINFRHEQGKDVHAPGFYLHISPDECFFVCGIWHPDGKTLAKIRKTIDKDSAGWKRITQSKTFRKHFELRGESLKRPPKGFKAEHPLIDDLKRKDFIAWSDVSFEELFAEDLVKSITAQMRRGKSLMSFLCGALGLPY